MHFFDLAALSSYNLLTHYDFLIVWGLVEKLLLPKSQRTFSAYLSAKLPRSGREMISRVIAKYH